MDEKLKTENLTRAIALLPKPKTFQPAIVTIAVGLLKYTFEKHNDKWYFVF